MSKPDCLIESGECPLPNHTYVPLESALGQPTEADGLVGLLVLVACFVLAYVWWRWVEPTVTRWQSNRAYAKHIANCPRQITRF